MGTNITDLPPRAIDEDKSETRVGSNGILENTVSMDEALKSADHAKIQPLTTSVNNIPGGVPTGANNAAALGSMLEAKLAIELIDSVLPGILVAALHALEIRLVKKDLQLTEKEKNIIAPIFQKCLDTIYLNFSSPWTMLAVTVGVIYGGKVTEKGLVAYIDRQKEEKPVNAIKTTSPDVSHDPGKTYEDELYNQSANTIITAIPTQDAPAPVKKWTVTPEKVKLFQKLRRTSKESATRALKRLHAQGAPDPTVY